jgi:DNA-binding IclR family transcriptional regulator
MPTIDRTASVLLAFTGPKAELGVTEIAEELGLAKSVVHRTLAALTETGLVMRAPGGRRYRLGPRAAELGFAALGTGDIRDLVLPTMIDLRDASDETVTASVLVGLSRTYVAQVESRQDVRMAVEIGTRLPLYAGASGRAILSAFDEEALDGYFRHVEMTALTDNTIVDVERQRSLIAGARKRGYAHGKAERDELAASVAAPLLSAGHVIGALSICGPVARFTKPAIDRFGVLVRDAAANLSTEQLNPNSGGRR